MSNVSASDRWWWGMAPVAVEVPCGGGTHELSWSGGVFISTAPVDQEAEDVLAALGGGACRCRDYADAWHEHRTDPAVLAVSSRHIDDRPGIERSDHDAAESQRLVTLHAWERHRARLATDLENDGEVAAVSADANVAAWRHRMGLHLLLCLPPDLQQRLAVEVCWALEQAWPGSGQGEVGAILRAALVGRAGPPLRAALAATGAIGPGDSPTIDIEMVGPDQQASIEVTRAAVGLEVVAALPVQWLRTVWGAGIATIGPRFVTSVTDASPDGVRSATTVTFQPDGKDRVVPVVDEWENEDPPSDEDLPV
ncbi:MAG: hypothetical protein ACR2H3_12605 [Acidimicrobiales bacterium]